jgi:hypothetical protein
MPASSRAKKFAAPAQTAGSYGTLFQMMSAGIALVLLHMLLPKTPL